GDLGLDLARAVEDRARDRPTALRLGNADLGLGGPRQPNLLQLEQALVHARGERATGSGDDEVIGRLPTELLDDLVGDRLRALGVDGPQGDVGELDAAGDRQLTAGSVGLVVVAVQLADGGAEGTAGPRLATLQVAGVKDVGGNTSLGGKRSDRGADVA